MSLLSEIKAAVTGCGLPVETGVFSGEPPEEYVVVTPLAITCRGMKPRRRGSPCSPKGTI